MDRIRSVLFGNWGQGWYEIPARELPGEGAKFARMCETK
jgi:hypothetical protein